MCIALVSAYLGENVVSEKEYLSAIFEALTQRVLWNVANLEEGESLRVVRGSFMGGAQ